MHSPSCVLNETQREEVFNLGVRYDLPVGPELTPVHQVLDLHKLFRLSLLGVVLTMLIAFHGRHSSLPCLTSSSLNTLEVCAAKTVLLASTLFRRHQLQAQRT